MQCLDSFFARCDHASSLLSSATGPSQISISEEQSDAICAILRRALSNNTFCKDIRDSVFKVASKICHIGFADVHEKCVMAALDNVVKRKVTWKMQDYTTIFQYWTETEWKKLGDMMKDKLGMGSLQQIEVALFRKAQLLCCRFPSEQSTKLWLAWVFTVRFGYDVALRHGPMLRKEHERLKNSYKLWIKGTNWDTRPTISTLSPDPRDFKSEYPDVYAAAFPDEEPVVCKHNLETIFQIATMWSCRGGVRQALVSDQLPNLQWYGGIAMPKFQTYQPKPMALGDTPENLFKRSDSSSTASEFGNHSPKPASSPTKSQFSGNAMVRHDGSLGGFCAAQPGPETNADYGASTKRAFGDAAKFQSDLGMADASAVLGAIRSEHDAKKAAKKAARQSLLAVARGSDSESDIPDSEVGALHAKAAAGKSLKRRPAASKPIVKKHIAAAKSKSVAGHLSAMKKKTAVAAAVGKSKSAGAQKKYMLCLEATRNQYVARSDVGTKTFPWGSGKRFKSEKAALAAGRGYFDEMLKPKKCTFPRHTMSLTI